MPCQAEYLSYIQGHVVELGPTMPPSWFCVSNQKGAFICFTQGLIFEDHVLTTTPTPMKWNGSPCTVPQVTFHSWRRCQHWFGEHRDAEGGVGEASSTEVPCEEGMEDESMHGDDGEDADDEDVDKESGSP